MTTAEPLFLRHNNVTHVLVKKKEMPAKSNTVELNEGSQNVLPSKG